MVLNKEEPVVAVRRRTPQMENGEHTCLCIIILFSPGAGGKGFYSAGIGICVELETDTFVYLLD